MRGLLSERILRSISNVRSYLMKEAAKMNFNRCFRELYKQTRTNSTSHSINFPSPGNTEPVYRLCIVEKYIY